MLNAQQHADSGILLLSHVFRRDSDGGRSAPAPLTQDGEEGAASLPTAAGNSAGPDKCSATAQPVAMEELRI